MGEGCATWLLWLLGGVLRGAGGQAGSGTDRPEVELSRSVAQGSVAEREPEESTLA